MPGADPAIIAWRLGIEVRTETMPRPLRGWIVRGQPIIYISDRLRGLARDRAIAHEVAEHSLSERLPEPLHERFCDDLSEALLGLF